MVSISYRLLVPGLILLFGAGCTTVPLTDGGEKVRLLSPADVSACRLLGKTHTSVTARALGMPRPPETITRELASIARNSAAQMGGDTVVPLTVISEGKQTFEVFKCVKPDG